MARKGLTATVAAAAARRPLALYLRLTVDRNGQKIGYDVQEAAARRWADYAGETIGRVYKDKDITAADRTKERPAYEQMLSDVEAGLWGGILVWRLDRLVRLMFEIERCIRLVEDAGGFIVSIEPSVIDSRDPLGKIFMRILVMFAEMEIDAMRSRQRGHRNERAKRGMVNGGGPRPFGFVGAVKDPETDRILNTGEFGVKHLTGEADLMREAARLVAGEGWGWGEVIQDWNSRTPPVRGTTGKPLSIFTLQRILTGLRAVGKREWELTDQETGETHTQIVKAVWDPILDEETWLRLRSLILKQVPYGRKALYLLTGEVTCGRCRQPLSGSKRKYVKSGEMVSTRTYRCKSGLAEKEAGSCGKLSVLADPVEKLVVAHALARIKETPELLETLVSKERAEVDTQLSVALTTITDCKNRLEELARAFGNRLLKFDEMMTAREPLEADKAAAESIVAGISKTVSIPVPVGAQREDLRRWFFDDLTLVQQRAVVSGMVESIEVLPVLKRCGRKTNSVVNGVRFDADRVVVRLAKPQVTRT